jgi:hypothetical protein
MAVGLKVRRGEGSSHVLSQDRVAALIYGKSADDVGIRQFGITRAEAMAYRDARAEAINDADWPDIEAQLVQA